MDTVDRLYTDPRIVSLYDALNPFAADTSFYIELAARTPAARIVDIGCGTGLLACELAMRGHEVTGIDPSSAMLDIARNRPRGDLVRWVEGDASSLDTVQNADLVMMTGHVAQVFLDDASWNATIRAAHRMLRQGGALAFESRNPLVKPWTEWTPHASRRALDIEGCGEVDVWHDLIDVQNERVRFTTHYQFKQNGDELVAASELRFRSQTALTRTLRDNGFLAIEWYGDWSRVPVDATSRELIAITPRA